MIFCSASWIGRRSEVWNAWLSWKICEIRKKSQQSFKIFTILLIKWSDTNKITIRLLKNKCVDINLLKIEIFSFKKAYISKSYYILLISYHYFQMSKRGLWSCQLLKINDYNKREISIKYKIYDLLKYITKMYQIPTIKNQSN